MIDKKIIKPNQINAFQIFQKIYLYPQKKKISLSIQIPRTSSFNTSNFLRGAASFLCHCMEACSDSGSQLCTLISSAVTFQLNTSYFTSLQNFTFHCRLCCLVDDRRKKNRLITMKFRIYANYETLNTFLTSPITPKQPSHYLTKVKIIPRNITFITFVVLRTSPRLH